MNEQNQSIALDGRRFEEAIRREAYCLWKLAGCQEGRDLDYWLQAKAIIQRRVDEDLEPPPILTKIVIDQRSAPEDRLATAQSEPTPAATAATTPPRQAMNLLAEPVTATAV